MSGIPCENCGESIHKTTITVTRHDLWQMGDHDERPLTKAFVCCSWSCADNMTGKLAATDPREFDPVQTISTWPDVCPTCGDGWRVKSKTMGAAMGQPHQGQCVRGHVWYETFR